MTHPSASPADVAGAPVRVVSGTTTESQAPSQVTLHSEITITGQAMSNVRIMARGRTYPELRQRLVAAHHQALAQLDGLIALGTQE